jgi:hypothetical protein
VATIIPIYRPGLTARESDRLEITITNCPERTVFFVGPNNLPVSWYRSRWPEIQFVGFDAHHFADISAYNRWMLTPELYDRFQDFEFTLICQTDALLVKPLPLLETWHFDYLGSPWDPPWRLGWNPIRRRLKHKGLTFPKRLLKVGNGGLSLRRTSVFRRHLRLPEFLHYPNEDIVISYFHRQLGIRLAEPDVAAQFFMELGAREWSPGMTIPEVFGFHALDKINPTLEEILIRRFLHGATGE